MRRIFTIVMSIAVLSAGSARADDAAPLYDPATVTTVDLTLSPAAEAALRADPKTYTDATLTMQLPGRTIGPYAIGVKLKGSTSFRDLDGKSAFRLKFAHSVKGQKVLGLKGATLNNMVQDASMVHETVAYSIFRAAGIPAPRTGYAYVRVNGQPFGLYLDLEPYDTVSLARLFTSTKHLYEGNQNADVTPDGRNQLEVDEGDEGDQSDLDALIAATNATSGDWSDGMAATADLDELTKMWATESFAAQWDGYSVFGDWGLTNNFYLHSDSAGRFRMLPSGADQAIVTWRKPIGEGIGRLFTQCQADASCLAQWRTALAGVSSTYAGMDIGSVFKTATDTVNRWRACPARELYAQDVWHDVTEDSQIFLTNRRQEVADYLAGGTAPAVPATTVPGVPAPSTAACPAPAAPTPTPSPVPSPSATPTPSPSPSPTPSPSPSPTPSPSPSPTASPSPEPSPEPQLDPEPARDTEPVITTDAATLLSDPSPTPVPLTAPFDLPDTTAAPCRVPPLAGHTLGAARRRLTVAHCATGAIVRRTVPTRGAWRVKATRPGTGAQRPAGTKVVVVLTRTR